ncbi:hypothetical protein SNEBB_006720 [Seison nebaliae]|nr:hypothetical protein SNEBB_006720 [Seison nebaliae]
MTSSTSNKSSLKNTKLHVDAFGLLSDENNLIEEEIDIDDISSFPFFQKGREIQSHHDNHQFSEKERKLLFTYESLDYLPTNSLVQRNWLQCQKRNVWERWIVMFLIGLVVGLIGFLLHEGIETLNDVKWKWTKHFLEIGGIQSLTAWGVAIAHGIPLIIISSSLVTFVCKPASGSGMPEIIAFLNGTIIRYIFNVKTLVTKFFSCILAVGSGLPVGPEGPMIHMGAMIGAGVSQFRSSTMQFSLGFFERFRNTEDRKNFIAAGSAAGVAAAFGAPVGGLLFAMEEVASFWHQKLSWQIFFCSMIAALTTGLFRSSFEHFLPVNRFGRFITNRYILFEINRSVDINLLTILPAIILGVFGGSFGAIFTFFNLKIRRGRKYILMSIKSPSRRNVAAISEGIINIILWISFSIGVSLLWKCQSYDYKCLDGECIELINYTCPIYQMNPMATLVWSGGDDIITKLLSRGTSGMFPISALIPVLVVYFILSCFAAGSHIASGIVVPMLIIGSLYGRILGEIMVNIFSVDLNNVYWEWMDPGAIALIGAASFFGGVSRLTMAVAIILIELTNDVKFLLPIMISIMVSKWISDQITHPLYHAILEIKCIPYLPSEPFISKKVRCEKTGISSKYADSLSVSNFMIQNVICIRQYESIERLKVILYSTTHGAFPVVTNASNYFIGNISRLELLHLLVDDKNYIEKSFKDYLDEIESHNKSSEINENNLLQSDIQKFNHILKSQLGRLLGPKDLVQERLQSKDSFAMKLSTIYNKFPVKDDNRETSHSVHYLFNTDITSPFIDLTIYINLSQPTVLSHWSLRRAFLLFQSFGLRHLYVTDMQNRVCGVLTRTTLMGSELERNVFD